MKLTLLFICVILQYTTSSRILGIIGSPSYSHQIFFRPLWRELANQGHELVVITSDPDPNNNNPNIKEVNTHESHALMKEMMDLMVNSSVFEILLGNEWQTKSLNLFKFQLDLPAVQEVINNKTEHFDLLIIEHYFTPHFGFKHRFQCPTIGVSSMDSLPVSHEVMGNTVHSVLYPSAMFPFQENLSFLERLGVVVFSNIFKYLLESTMDDMTAIGRKYFGEDMPSIKELFDDTDMLFVNANPVFSAVRPHTPSTISIAGGMHLNEPQALPKDLKQYLDKAKDGFIYFSLGTNVMSNELSEQLQQTIIETFSQLPYQILWKFEDDNLKDKPINVKIIKWAPQQDILRHENIKLFITQGGLQSLEEALYMHVPMVVIPFIADQKSNADKVQHKKLGVTLDWKSLTVAEFKTSILEVITNPIYKKTIKKLADEIQDEPLTPVNKAVWWVEYVLRHKGAKHLKGPQIPLYQYYYFDVLTVLGLIILFLIIVFWFIVKYLFKTVCYLIGSGKSRDSNDKNKKRN